MTLAQLRRGHAVFVDANIFVYHFAPDPQFQAASSLFLQRIAILDLAGFTSTAILSEAAHRLMMIEARTSLQQSSGKLLARLRQNPSALQSLTGFHAAVANILQSPIQVLTIPPPLILAAATISQQHGLLSNDALIVAVMRSNGLTKLASNDADFDRAPGIVRYAPV